MADETRTDPRRLTEKTLETVYTTLEWGLAGAIEGQGGVLLGFSFKTTAWDCLMTIRADHGGSSVVCFIGSDTVPNCILKAHRDAQNDLLRWKPCRYAGK